jgi:7,8-dihydropterin-6-yl-methyl-4-(beta-D-ribofuranosyl)aminobenzene 5'-phosphate synthase
MATRLKSVKEVDSLVVTVITDNYYDALRPDTKVSTPFRSKPGSIIHAEHGLSYHVETQGDRPSSSLLFDHGMDPMRMTHNMEVLGIDADKINAMALSHGHFDHWGGLGEFLRHHGNRIPEGTPLYVGEEAFARRFARRPSDKEPQDIGALDRNEIEKLGVIKIVGVRESREIIPGGCLTGRVSDYIVPTHCKGLWG